MGFYNWVKNNITIDDLEKEGLSDVLIVTDIKHVNKIKELFPDVEIRYPERTLLYLRKQYIKANTDGSIASIRALSTECGLKERSTNGLLKELNRNNSLRSYKKVKLTIDNTNNKAIQE
ncbi:MAG: hypothetical protein AB1782_14845 [Cyanobacteriota bacterium]